MSSNENAGAGNDDIVDTIAQYDLDDDFPDYANEQNRELNTIVSAKGNIQKTPASTDC